MPQKTDILIISKNQCNYCQQLKNRLDRARIGYREINAEEDFTVYSELGGKTALDYIRQDCPQTQMPTVIVTSVSFSMFWQGSRPDQIVTLLYRIRDEIEPEPEKPTIDVDEVTLLVSAAFRSLEHVEDSPYLFDEERELVVSQTSPAAPPRAQVPLLRLDQEGRPSARLTATIDLRLDGPAH